jgi:signal transduction histidine kinase
MYEGRLSLDRSDVLKHIAGTDTSPAEMQLVRELCHDLIDPAASITLLAHAAGADAGADASVQRHLQLIAAEAGRIADICGQVLNRPSSPKPVRLDELALQAADSARLRHGGTVTVAASPVTLSIHPAIVVRILNNLLTNACRAAGKAGQVHVLVACDGDWARLSVADSGDGLRPRQAGRPRFGLEIIGSLVLGCGGTVQLGVGDLGGLCVVVILPCHRPGETGSAAQ